MFATFAALATVPSTTTGGPENDRVRITDPSYERIRADPDTRQVAVTADDGTEIVIDASTLLVLQSRLRDAMRFARWAGMNDPVISPRPSDSKYRDQDDEWAHLRGEVER